MSCDLYNSREELIRWSTWNLQKRADEDWIVLLFDTAVSGTGLFLLVSETLLNLPKGVCDVMRKYVAMPVYLHIVLAFLKFIPKSLCYPNLIEGECAKMIRPSKEKSFHFFNSDSRGDVKVFADDLVAADDELREISEMFENQISTGQYPCIGQKKIDSLLEGKHAECTIFICLPPDSMA